MTLSGEEVQKLLLQTEGHFVDFKAIDIKPAKLTRTISAFANADGGEIFVGISQPSQGGRIRWQGFSNIEAANGHIQAIEEILPFGKFNRMEFFSRGGGDGLVLHIEVMKAREIVNDTSGGVYVRRGAQNQPVSTPEQKERLELLKGIQSYEEHTVNVNETLITNSIKILEFVLEVVPYQEPDQWLKKEMLLIEGKPTVAGVTLFADYPQAALPKRCGVKVYRYKTYEEEGTREALDGQPVTIEGCLYDQVYGAVAETKQILEKISRMTPTGLERIEYPEETLHEIITNAVIHRDYSIRDDIHIRIYDDRVEVESPGALPGHITPENILDERYSRNGKIVSVINKFPNPPNKDVGEGLNTAFRAMRLLRLKEPEILAKPNSVLVIIKHERLASPEDSVMQYLEDHPYINNRTARELCAIREDWRIRYMFQRMVGAGMIEKVRGSTTSNTKYRKVQGSYRSR